MQIFLQLYAAAAGGYQSNLAIRTTKHTIGSR